MKKKYAILFCFLIIVRVFSSFCISSPVYSLFCAIFLNGLILAKIDDTFGTT